MKESEYQRVVHFVATEQKAGASFLRQKLLLSDSKLQRLLKRMEADGVVSKALPGGGRNVLVPVPPPPVEPEEDLGAE